MIGAGGGLSNGDGSSLANGKTNGDVSRRLGSGNEGSGGADPSKKAPPPKPPMPAVAKESKDTVRSFVLRLYRLAKYKLTIKLTIKSSLRFRSLLLLKWRSRRNPAGWKS